MGSANSGSTQPFNLADRYRAHLPQTSGAGDAAHVANARHLEQKVNQLPIDTSFLWLGGGSGSAIPNAVITPLILDGEAFATEGFKIDVANSLITVERAGWYEFSIGIFTGTPSAISAVLIINNNTSGTPYISPQMNFFTADNTGARAQGTLGGPIGTSDTVQIGAFLGSGPATVQVDNVFAHWVRPYYV